MCIQSKWEQELNVTFSPQQKHRILYYALKSEHKFKKPNLRYSLGGTELLRSSHKQFPDSTDHCWRDNMAKGSALHIFWPCLPLRPSWTEVSKISQKFTDFYHIRLSVIFPIASLLD